MKLLFRHLSLFIYCCLFAALSPAQNTTFHWKQKADFMGGGIEGAVAFSVDGMGYVCMGVGGKDCWRYDPKQDMWRKMADFPGKPRKNATVFTIGDKAYLATGADMSPGSNGDLNDVWEYDPVSDRWTQLGDFPGGKRQGAIAFTVDGKGYIGLGARPGQADSYSDLWEYHPKSDKWTRKADFPLFGRVHASVFVVNSDAFVLFGTEGIKLTEPKNHVYRYSTTNNVWIRDANFLGPLRGGATVFSLDNTGYVFSGYDQDQKWLSDLWEYSLPDRVWKQQTNDTLPPARANAFCFVIDGAAYIGTGVTKKGAAEKKTDDFWCLRTTTIMDYNAKLLYKNNDRKVPLAKQDVSLVSKKTVLQTTTTDSNGAFGFKKIDINGNYQLVLAKNDKLPANAVVSLAKPSGKIVKDLTKNSDDLYTYKLSKLDFLDEDDYYFNLKFFIKSSDTATTITTHINYPSNGWTLSDSAEEILYEVIVSLNQYPNLVVQVSSFTDNIGTDEDNMVLSDKRAQTVIAYIVSNGIDPKRVSGRGYGSSRPISQCNPCSDAQNQVNRRTEFRFIKRK